MIERNIINSIKGRTVAAQLLGFHKHFFIELVKAHHGLQRINYKSNQKDK